MPFCPTPREIEQELERVIEEESYRAPLVIFSEAEIERMTPRQREEAQEVLIRMWWKKRGYGDHLSSNKS